MPELPEVETTAIQLRNQYKGMRIIEVLVQPVTIFQNVQPTDFAKRIKGKTLKQISRHGKYLIWEMENLCAVFHLGMSGIFIGDRERSHYPQHIHISFTFEYGNELFFQDVRKFSKVWLHAAIPKFIDVGEDVLSEKFTLNKFKKLLNLRSVSIKNLLMDQRMMAGIGNIYASEILFDAGVHPDRKCSGLNEIEIRRLHRSLKKIIKLAIDRFGTTYTAYLTVEGTPGENQNFLKVYQRDGQFCVNCESPIEKYILNSRSTFYCPKCQK
jgi:formamidopyrimidine-DNA glycosylase